MSITPETALGQALAEQARTYLGTPFRHAGRSREFGVDCVGLLACTAHDLGLTVYDNTNYSRTVNPEVLRAEIEAFCQEVERSTAQPGDVLLFSCGNLQHVGMVTRVEPSGRVWFAHSFETLKRVVEDPLILTWSERLVRVYRWNRS